MSDASTTKVLGFIPKAKYVSYMYMSLLSGIVIGFVLTLLGVVGISLGLLNILPGLLSIAALILALLGIFLLQNEFSALDRSHFIYVGVVYLVAWFTAMLFGNALSFLPILAQLFVLAISAAAAVLIWTGFNSWQGGRAINKDNIKSEVRIALKNR